MAKIYRFIFSGLLILLSLIGKSQTVDGKLYTIFNNWYQWSGGKFNTNLNIPKVTATTGRDTGGIRYNLADSSMYIWTGSQWRAVGSSLDTSSLSNRINQRVKYTDTAAMLSPYLRNIPTLQQVTTAGNSTTDSINVIDGTNNRLISLYAERESGPLNFRNSFIKLKNNYATNTLTITDQSFRFFENGFTSRISSNITKSNILSFPDSSGILTQRVKVNGTTYNTANNGVIDLGTISTDTTSLSNRINERVKYTDTAAMLTPYLRKIDTTTAFLISVSQPNDSTLRFAKGATQTDYIIRSAVAGSATRLTTTVYNNSGATILKGAVVYINGRHSSNLPTIALAQANNEANSYTTFALVETDIANGAAGLVIQVGDIGNLNLPTSTYSDGQVLYLSPTVPGGYTTTKPLAPNHITKIGTVTRAHPTLGSIQIKIENGWQLDELSDVQIAAVPNDSTILQFSRVDSLWKAVDPTTAMGNRFVRRTDTAAMLLPYLRKVDTLSLSNRITAAAAGAIAWDAADSLYSSAQLKKGTFRTYDFDGTSGVSGFPQGSGDVIFISATTASGTFLNIRDNNINGISISTGGSASSNPCLTNGYGTSVNVTHDITGSNIKSTWMHFRVRTPTLNDGTQRFYTVIGWKVGTAANPTESAYFTYDLDGTQTGSTASANWQTVSALGGNREWTTTSSAVPANTWQTLSIRATISSVQFYIDGTLVSTHTTRIPATGRMHLQIFKTNGTTARLLDVDYATFNQLNQSDR